MRNLLLKICDFTIRFNQPKSECPMKCIRGGIDDLCACALLCEKPLLEVFHTIISPAYSSANINHKRSYSAFHGAALFFR